jgi:hypothetical protein
MTASNTVIDIAATFKAIYGYSPAHVPALPASPDNTNPYSVFPQAIKKTTTATGSPLYGLSDMIGREVFMPITLKSNGVNYDFPFGIIGLKNKILEKSTPMTERGGEVIEEIAIGAWTFTFKGFLIDPNDNFPDEQLAALNRLYTNRVPVELQCALTDIFLPAPNQVVLLSLDIPQKAKVIGVRDFAFEMKQDSILDLYKIS